MKRRVFLWNGSCSCARWLKRDDTWRWIDRNHQVSAKSFAISWLTSLNQNKNYLNLVESTTPVRLQASSASRNNLLTQQCLSFILPLCQVYYQWSIFFPCSWFSFICASVFLYGFYAEKLSLYMISRSTKSSKSFSYSSFLIFFFLNCFCCLFLSLCISVLSENWYCLKRIWGLIFTFFLCFGALGKLSLWKSNIDVSSKSLFLLCKAEPSYCQTSQTLATHLPPMPFNNHANHRHRLINASTEGLMREKWWGKGRKKVK